MKKQYAIILVVFCAVILSACQPTPEEDFVVYKETEDIYRGTPVISVPSESIHEARDWEWKHLELQDNYRGADDSVEIIVDLKGQYLDKNVPVLRASHKDLTPDYLKTMAQAIMPSEEYYDPVKSIDKKSIQEWIDKLEIRTQESFYEGKSLSDNAIRDSIKRAQDDIQYYIGLIEEIESREDDPLTDWEMKRGSSYYHLIREPLDDFDREDYMLAIRTPYNEAGEFGSMFISTWSTDSFRSNELEYYKANTYFNPGFTVGVRDRSRDAANTLNTAEALEMVRGELKKIGLDYYHPVSVRYEGGYMFWFFPSYLGLDYITVQTESEYAEEHMPERFYVNVSGDQIYHMKLMNATDVIIENDSLEMISADEAAGSLKQYMQTVFTRSKVLEADPFFASLYKNCDVKIEITDLKFGYVRIPIKNVPAEFRLVPSWVFCGNRYAKVGDDYEQLPAVLNTGLETTETLMVINAIDGSYIDHYDGYLQ